MFGTGTCQMSVTLEASDITIELGAASRGKPKPSAVNLVRNPSEKSAAFKVTKSLRHTLSGCRNQSLFDPPTFST